MRSSPTSAAGSSRRVWPEREGVADFIAGRTARDDAQARPITGRRTTTGAGSRPGSTPSPIHDRDRRTGHPLHPRSLEARKRAAAHRHPRLARLDHRAVEDIDAADRSHGAWRQRSGRVPPGDPVDAGLRLFRQAGDAPAGAPSASPGLGDADERLAIPATSRRAATGARSSSTGWACRRRRAARHPHQHARRGPAEVDKASQPARRRRPASPDEERRASSSSLDIKQVAYARMMGDAPADPLRIADSPVGLAAWLLDHNDADGQPAATVAARCDEPRAPASLPATRSSTTSRSTG